MVGVEAYFHSFLTTALQGLQWSTSHTGHFICRGQSPGTHLEQGWVGPRARQDILEKR